MALNKETNIAPETGSVVEETVPPNMALDQETNIAPETETVVEENC